MTVPDAAIEAAAEAIDSHDDWYGTEDGEFICDGCPTVLGTYSDGIEPHMALYHHRARAAIEAAMPAIREAIAQEIEASVAVTDHPDGSFSGTIYHAQYTHGIEDAAAIARGGAA